MVTQRSLASAVGFLSMFGGALFGLLLFLFVGVFRADTADVGLSAAGTMLTLSLLFLVPAAAGLYLLQRPDTGVVGTVAWLPLQAGLVAFLVTGTLDLLAVSYPYAELVGTVQLGLLLVGGVAFGLLTASHDVFVHSTDGGLLLAASVPVLVGVEPALSALGVDVPLVGSLLAAAPFSLAWLLLGLDMLTAGDGGVDRTDIRTPGEG